MDYIIKSSYGNDSCALIQWAYENSLTNVTVLYNDTGWARADWKSRVEQIGEWVTSLGFSTASTQSIGLEALVRNHSGWPRQGMQFCTHELKIKPTNQWLDKHDPYRLAVMLIGVRREESVGRRKFPVFSVSRDGDTIWAPLVNHTEQMRNELLKRANIEPIPHRSSECFPCINSNRRDLLELAKDESRVALIDKIEKELGYTSKGKPKTMFRPYQHMGATGIREIIRWAKSERGKFDLDDGNGSSGCEVGWCGL